MNKNLYELTKEWMEIKNLLENANDEELDTLDLNIAFSEINEARHKKIENCIKLFKSFEVLADSIKAERKRLSEYQARVDARAERIKLWLEYNLLAGESFQFPTGEIGWRKSKSIKPTTENAPIPECYQRVSIEPNKTLMTQDIKSGATIPGWALVEEIKLNIR